MGRGMEGKVWRRCCKGDPKDRRRQHGGLSLPEAICPEGMMVDG